MGVQVEKLENSMAKLTIEISAEDFDQAVQQVYLKNRSQILIPGFRKGKAPRQMIEKMYGSSIFFEDAINNLLPDAYDQAVTESGLTIVSQPDIEVTQAEKGKPLIFTAEVAVRPEVTLGEYKGLAIETAPVTVSDEEVDQELSRVQEQNARIVPVEDRAVEDGDIAVIDYEGFCDGTAFEGGKGEDYELTIGSHSFIDNFEEQLIGLNPGDEHEVHVTFPEQYQEASLAGKPAVFEVTVKQIKKKELPDLDDDFASDVSDYETMDEYRESVVGQITERKKNEAKQNAENELVDLAIDNAAFDMPDPMVVSEARRMVDEFSEQLQYQGMTLDQYLQYAGMTKESLQEQFKPQAKNRISSRLVLEAIADAESITADEEEVDKEIQNMATSYQMEADKVREYLGDEGLKSVGMDIAVQKAIDFLYDNAVITEKAPEEKTEEEEQSTEAAGEEKDQTEEVSDGKEETDSSEETVSGEETN